jgi:type I restriction enzyme M protein
VVSEIAEQAYSLNPGRYVGIAPQPEDDFDFHEKLQELHAEFEMLTVEARELEGRISKTIDGLLKVTENE